MILACAKCTHLYELTDPRPGHGRICSRCEVLAELLDCADSLVLWRLKVDVTSGSEAADQLYALVDRLEAAAAKVRAS